MELRKKANMFNNLKWYEHIAAGWSLILLIIGGVVGGAIGGLAYFLNVKIFNLKISKIKKYIYAILVGIAAIAAYLSLAVYLVLTFPGLFKK